MAGDPVPTGTDAATGTGARTADVIAATGTGNGGAGGTGEDGGTCAARLQLTVVPVTLRIAAAFITAHHRNLGPPAGHRFSIGAAAGGVLVGVAVVGRPVARHLDDGVTAEVNRLCTDGTPNACSLLLATCWRAAKAIGYRRLITYTRTDESGTSLRAAGWQPVATRPANTGWNRPSRHRRTDPTTAVARTLWQQQAPGGGR